MGKFKANPSAEVRRKPRRYAPVAAVTAILVAAIIILTALYIGSQNERNALEAALTDAEKKLALREDVVSALEAQQQEQESTIASLQSQLENALHIEEARPVITSDQIREQISSVSELVTQRYVYTNAARRETSKTWLWGWTLPFSDTSILVTYDGEVKAGIDFSAIQVDVNEDTRTITVTLPHSKVVNNNIPQETINVLEVKNNLFNEVTFDDYNAFISAEKPIMQEKAIEMGLLDDADREAEAIIRAFLSLLPGIGSYTLNVTTK